MTSLTLKFTGNHPRDLQILRKAASLLKRGEIGVLPTDTLYGIVAKALDRRAVAKIYRLRRRQKTKPFIVLISSIRDLAMFNASLDGFAAKLLSRIWPGKVSVILPCGNPDLNYLLRGGDSLAFRLPADHNLRSLIKQTGPLVAPSANLEGQRPAQTVAEARKYFGDKVAFYADAGSKYSLPSTLIKIRDGKINVLRTGAAIINESLG